MTDRQIRQAAAQGGITRLRDLTQAFGVGSCCGKCLPEAQATLSACLDAKKESLGTGFMLPA